MQAVKGYISNGRFTPNDEFMLPNYARVMLVIEEVIENPTGKELLSDKADDSAHQARVEWLNRVESLLELSMDEDLSNFPKQELMKNPNDYTWFD